LTGSDSPFSNCAGPETDRERLCDLLLQVAGRDTNRLPSVKRHAAVLDAALPYMNHAQAGIARARIHKLEDWYGSLLSGGQNEPETRGISPEERVDKWLSERRDRERLLNVMHAAACAVFGGETKLMRVMDAAYRHQYDGVLSPPSVDSFREWLVILQIAHRAGPAHYEPGNLCRWWVEEMNPTGSKDSAYAACLKRRGSRKQTAGERTLSSPACPDSADEKPFSHSARCNTQ
jgi:hypothetical protein